MKKIAVIFFFLAALSVYGQSSRTVLLDDAISNSVRHIQERLESDSTIVVYNFQSQIEGLSNYVLGELFDQLVNTYRFTVLDRNAQSVIDAEIDFQFRTSAGMISDESLMSLTRRIGAQAIIIGSLEYIGSEYRFRIRVIGTETVAALVSYVASIPQNDRRIAAFSGPRTKTAGENFGTGALNIFIGLGSYIDRDIRGGLPITAGYLIAAGLLAVEALYMDWDHPAVGIPGTIGFSVAGITLFYGFTRPFTYSRQQNNRLRQVASVMDNAHIRPVRTSDRNAESSSLGVQLSYSIKF